MEIKKFQKFLTQKRWLILIIIFFVTLIFHSLIIFNTIRDDKPFVKYPVLAEKFIQGDLHKERLMDVSPLYFYLHVLARKMSVNPILLIQWLQLFLTAFSAVFFFLILKKYFTYPITLFGICLFILSNSVINHTNIMEPEILLLFFILGFIHFGSKGEEKNKLICGIFFALSLLTRPILFPFIVLVPLFFVLNRSQHRNLKTSIILFLIPTVLALSFLWIRNTIITGSFTPYVMNPGYILFEGNNPNSIGQSAIYPTLVDELANKGTPEPDKHHVVYRMIARRTSDKDLSIQEVNNFWSRKVKNFIMDHPVRFFKLLLVKSKYIFHNFQRHDLIQSKKNRQRMKEMGFPTFPFWIISTIALLGMLVARTRWREFFLFYFIFLNYFVLMLLTYVSERQRLVIFPIFLFFFINALHFTFQKKKNLIIVLIILIPAYFTLYQKNDYMKEENQLSRIYDQSYKLWIEARSQRNRFNLSEAKKNSARSMALTPWLKEYRRPVCLSFSPNGFANVALQYGISDKKSSFTSRYNQAILLFEAGKHTESEILLKKLIANGNKFKRAFIHSSQPSFYLGRIAESRGNWKQAIFYFKQALENAPGSPFSLSHLFALTEKPEYERKLNRYFDKLDANMFIAEALLLVKKSSRAIPYLNYVTKKIPEFRKAYIYLSLALGRNGQITQAVQAYIQALRIKIEPVCFEKEILDVFKNFYHQNKKDPMRRFYYGWILHHFGYYSEALKKLQDTLELIPDNQTIKKEIELVKRNLQVHKKRETTFPPH